MEKLWKVVSSAISVFLILSIALNIFLYIQRDKPLIAIDKRIYNDQRQDQSQWQGQLILNGYMSSGNKIIWNSKLFPIDDKTSPIDSVKNYLTSLPPQYSYFVRIVHYPNIGTVVFTPEFMEIKK